jgi:hypothetical protein
MSLRPHVSLPISELVTLLEASLLFVLQWLIARHPDLLAAPEEAETIRPAIPLYGARRLLAAIRELSHALENYHEALHDRPRSSAGDDDIPF